MKKSFAGIVSLMLAVLIIASFSGCGTQNSTSSGKSSQVSTSAQESSNQEQAATTASPEKKDVTISFLASQDWIFDAEQKLAQKFEESTGIKVDFQIVPAAQYFNLLLTKLNAGECADIFGSQSGKFDIVSQLNIEKNAIDLTQESWVSRFDKFSAEQLTVNNKLYGMTFYDTTTDFFMVYNKKIFEKVGAAVPKSFAEFKDVCEKIKKAGITPFYECAGDGWHHVMWFCEIGARFEQLNNGIIDKLNNNQATFESDTDFLKCMQEIKEMADLGYWGKNYLSYTYADLPKYMNNGTCAMTMAKPGTINEIVAFDQSKCKAEDFGMFLIPTMDSQILNVHPCGPSRFIYSGSKNTAEAKEYFTFISQPENLQFMIDNEAKIENLPFSDLKAEYSDYTKQFLAENQSRGVVLQDSVKYLNPQWFDIGKDISAMVTGTITPEEVIKNIDMRRTQQAQAAKDPLWAK